MKCYGQINRKKTTFSDKPQEILFIFNLFFFLTLLKPCRCANPSYRKNHKQLADCIKLCWWFRLAAEISGIYCIKCMFLSYIFLGFLVVHTLVMDICESEINKSLAQCLHSFTCKQINGL